MSNSKFNAAMGKPNEPVSVSTWHCLTCNDDVVMTHAEMLAHLNVVHKIPTIGLKGMRQLNMHMDSTAYFISDYEWTIYHPLQDIKLHNFVKCLRRRK